MEDNTITIYRDTETYPGSPYSPRLIYVSNKSPLFEPMYVRSDHGEPAC